MKEIAKGIAKVQPRLNKTQRERRWRIKTRHEFSDSRDAGRGGGDDGSDVLKTGKCLLTRTDCMSEMQIEGNR